MPPTNRPTRVTVALLALSTACVLTAGELAVNQLFLGGTAIGPGPVVGIAALIVQAATIVLLARRSSGARFVVVIFLLLSATTLSLATTVAGNGAYGIAAYLVIGFLLKAGATALLFTSESNRWFSAAG